MRQHADRRDPQGSLSLRDPALGYRPASGGSRVVARGHHRTGGRVTPKGTRLTDQAGRAPRCGIAGNSSIGGVFAAKCRGRSGDDRRYPRGLAWASALMRLFRPRGLDPAPALTVPDGPPSADACGDTPAALVPAVSAVWSCPAGWSPWVRWSPHGRFAW